MDKKFEAMNWFLDKGMNSSPFNHQKKRSPFEDFIGVSEKSKFVTAQEPLPGKINITNCFTPGWMGNALLSKEASYFTKFLNLLSEDVKSMLLKNKVLPISLRRVFYNDFSSFCEFQNLLCDEITESNILDHIHDENSPHREDLFKYIDIFSFRTSVLYFFKLRFLVLISENSSKEFDKKFIYNLNAYFTSLFPKGSKIEISSKAFSTNIYGWYRPSKNIPGFSVDKILSIIHELSISDLLKQISLKNEALLSCETRYSHSYSHKNFGLFLNTLFVNFPKWFASTRKFPHLRTGHYIENMEILSTKFEGDFLEGLSQSHWLAQEANTYIHWEELLCSDFKSTNYITGDYLKLLNELQFFTFLNDLAKQKNLEPKHFISSVITKHIKNKDENAQASNVLPILGMGPARSQYDRILLNIGRFPKNNSQNYLANKISDEVKNLKHDGYLFVVSSKKLFIPSQKDKVESLLKELCLEVIISLSELKGKGEVGPYIYIFKKRTINLTKPKSQKEICYTFRISGELKHFNKIEILTDYLNRFFEEYFENPPSMYQKEIDSTFYLEFFQDAIINGRLIHSFSKDSSKITHPHFFKALLKSCKNFGHYFSIKPIQKSGYEEEGFLNQMSDNITPPYVAIIDKRDESQTRLEIIPYKDLEIKIYNYGVAECSYYGINPKWPNLNILTINEFYASPIGKQIVDLSFGSSNARIKSALETLLAPTFFETKRPLPEHHKQGISLLLLEHQEIFETHPQILEERYKNISILLPSMANEYPSDVLNYLAHFKRSLNTCSFYLAQERGSLSINFNNPLFYAPLKSAPTEHIYPNNKEIYIKFEMNSSISLLHGPLSFVKMKIVNTEEYEGATLELYNEDSLKIATLHSEENMIYFLEFILKNSTGIPISKLLQNLRVPKISKLDEVITSIKQLEKTISALEQDVNKTFIHILQNLFMRNNS